MLLQAVLVSTAAAALGHQETSGQQSMVSYLVFLFSGIPWRESRSHS